ncbi:DUF1433 domain-containing protein [Macrococcus capreoli]
MTKKKILPLIIVILSACIIAGGVYFKMKYDEREKDKEVYIKGQKELITLYLKHNTKEPNTIKTVDFTKVEMGPMGDYVFDGYINGNKDAEFSAFSSPEDNFQFHGTIMKAESISNLLKPAHELKSPEEIKKELNQKTKNTQH